MTITTCLDKRFSTTRMVCNIKPDLCILPNQLFESSFFLKKQGHRVDECGLRTAGYYKKTSLDKPLLTVITAVFNGENHLEETILSVLNQTYDNVEFIIIDGGSTDGTLEILKKYEHAIDYWISEKDSGISDAFNKGVQVASGDYINFQGDGDGFYGAEALEKIIQGVNPNNDLFISGLIQRVSVDDSEIYVSPFMPKFHKTSLLFRMSMAHQGLFTNIKYFKKYGLFDVNNTYCMDYEHLLRAYHSFPRVVMKNIIVAKWRADGLGNNRDLEVFKEYHKIKVDNKVTMYPILKAINFWILLKHYIRKMIK